MTKLGRYGDDRACSLPPTWTAVTDEVIETALEQTLIAATGDRASKDLARYYDRAGSYSGTLFLDVEPNDPDNVEAANLYAVTTLSITLDARQGRLLLEEGDLRADVRRRLRQLQPATLPITDPPSMQSTWWAAGRDPADGREGPAVPVRCSQEG